MPTNPMRGQVRGSMIVCKSFQNQRIGCSTDITVPNILLLYYNYSMKSISYNVKCRCFASTMSSFHVQSKLKCMERSMDLPSHVFSECETPLQFFYTVIKASFCYVFYMLLLLSFSSLKYFFWATSHIIIVLIEHNLIKECASTLYLGFITLFLLVY